MKEQDPECEHFCMSIAAAVALEQADFTGHRLRRFGTGRPIEGSAKFTVAIPKMGCYNTPL